MTAHEIESAIAQDSVERLNVTMQELNREIACGCLLGTNLQELFGGVNSSDMATRRSQAEGLGALSATHVENIHAGSDVSGELARQDLLTNHVAKIAEAPDPLSFG
jgi:hypothetical protein